MGVIVFVAENAGIVKTHAFSPHPLLAPQGAKATPLFRLPRCETPKQLHILGQSQAFSL
jgi:hypothetical protein